ncbi:MAG: hypothetical protein H8E57_09010 [Candidatus Cloacimonetes bacterium]|nr:hypothetical protein [Candidatus Cloacimonadota bacterium]
MNFLFGSLFWGILLVLLGLSVILKAFFKIDIPVFRTIFAVIIIYWGVKMLFGGFHFKTDNNTVMFNSSRMSSKGQNDEYNIIFGSSEIDLTTIDVAEKSVYARANVVFGSGVIYIDPQVPTIIRVSTVFAESKLPGRTVSFFGDYVYRSADFSKADNHLTLKIDVVFGSVLIVEK